MLARSSRGVWAGAIFSCFTITHFALGAPAYTLKILVDFESESMGGRPIGKLTSDAAGNLCGATISAGPSGRGTIFKLDAAHNYAFSILANVPPSADAPLGDFTIDAGGNIYGTTYGLPNGGSVFKLSPVNNYAWTTLFTFNGANGANPSPGLVMDGVGNFYGTTEHGGPSNKGTVFKLDPAHGNVLTTLVNFNGTNGAYPQSALAVDAAGNLYGTTGEGGTADEGTIFKLDATNNFTLSTLVTFNEFPHTFTEYRGKFPLTSLIFDGTGILYGGSYGNGYGDLFKLDTKHGNFASTLARFDNYITGENPNSPLLMDSAGNLFGTTGAGGGRGGGTIFEAEKSKNYAITSLIDFDGTNGGYPRSGLTVDPFGHMFGTTDFGGTHDDGIVYELILAPEPATLSLLAGAFVGLLQRRRRAFRHWSTA